MSKAKTDKKQLAIALVCFLGAIIFAITSIIPHKYDKGKVIEDTQSVKAEDKAEEIDVVGKEENSKYDTYNETSWNTEISEISEEMESEQEYQMYQENFKLEKLNEELLPFVENDTAGMMESIQKTLYENGFYDYSSAIFNDFVEFDYSKYTISFSFLVQANETVNMTVIYYRESKQWISQIW